MGPFGPGSFYTKGVLKALQKARVEVAVVNVLMKGSTKQVGSILSEKECFSSCIALGWGSGDSDFDSIIQAMLHTPLASEHFGKIIAPWVERGGRFIIQGENPHRFSGWPKWFGKSWKGSSDNGCTDYVCNGKSDDDIHWCKWYHKAEGAITTGRYNVTAASISGVAPEDNLFRDTDTDESAVALAKYGKGSISYFGDANAEDATCDIMAIIARGE